MNEIINPTLQGMEKEGAPFTGVLFAGLMIVQTPQGPTPKLIEHNVRFGDPECQSLMLRLKSDFLPVLLAAAKGELGNTKLEWNDQSAICIVMAAKGYPGDYEKNTEIKNLEEAAQVPGTIIFHAGTRRDEKGTLLSIGGRVLGVCAMAETIEKAQKLGYQAVDKINWPQGFCRRDIGWRAIEKLKQSA
jgi:phosphoribosylamine--glycine ligase